MAVNLIDSNDIQVSQTGNNIQLNINRELLYPIGSIYMSINNTNPSQIFGGVWERIAKGKTLVGVDEDDTDFASSELTGGEKEHTLTVDEIPAHHHSYNASDVNNYVRVEASSTYGRSANINRNTGNTGGGQAHNNLQPYYTCYIFVRTA